MAAVVVVIAVVVVVVVVATSVFAPDKHLYYILVQAVGSDPMHFFFFVEDVSRRCMLLKG